MTAGFTFATTPRVVCRAGAAADLGAILDGRLGPRVLLVTDAGVRGAGLTEASLASLRAAGIAVAVFDGVHADPPEADVLAGVEAARAHGATGIVGLGGGSPLDVAKLVALLVGSGETLAGLYGVGLAKGPRLPLALVPTTAGTGSEATPISIVTTGKGADGAAEKKGVVAPVLLPDFAVLDAALTLHLPPAATAATGVDAMVHAIEAHASASANNNPVSRALAREALRLLGANIEAATLSPPDLAVREAMLLGSFLAGQAFANSPVAAVHALAYPLAPGTGSRTGCRTRSCFRTCCASTSRWARLWPRTQRLRRTCSPSLRTSRPRMRAPRVSWTNSRPCPPGWAFRRACATRACPKAVLPRSRLTR